MASKKIYLRRVKSKANLSPKILAEAKPRLGSVYKNRMPLRGITEEEEAKFLPQIHGVSPSDKDFRRESDKYWREMGFMIPYGGLELEAGKDEEGNPIDLNDYLRYRFAIAHPEVAISESKRSATTRFFIEDPETKKDAANRRRQILDKADEVYLKIKKIDDTVAMILSIMLPTANTQYLSKEAKLTTLRELRDKDPRLFVSLATDTTLKYKSLLTRLHSADVISRMGETYIYKDITMGHTEEQAIAWVKDKGNSEHLLTMKTILEEKSKVVA